MTGRHELVYRGRHEKPDTRDGETYQGRHRKPVFDEWLRIAQQEPLPRRSAGK